MSPPTATWRVWVTEEDLRQARSAWLRARDGGAPAERVRDLREELERLSRTAAFQDHGEPWRTAARPGTTRGVSSLTERRFLRPPVRLPRTG